MTKGNLLQVQTEPSLVVAECSVFMSEGNIFVKGIMIFLNRGFGSLQELIGIELTQQGIWMLQIKFA